MNPLQKISSEEQKNYPTLEEATKIHTKSLRQKGRKSKNNIEKKNKHNSATKNSRDSKE